MFSGAELLAWSLGGVIVGIIFGLALAWGTK